jgi:hypothetical protein
VLRDAALGPADLGERLRAAGIPVESAEPVLPSLEDVFLDVVDSPERFARRRTRVGSSSFGEVPPERFARRRT